MVVVRAKRRGGQTTMAALAEEEGNGECGREEAAGGASSLSRQCGAPEAEGEAAVAETETDPIEEQGRQTDMLFLQSNH